MFKEIINHICWHFRFFGLLSFRGILNIAFYLFIFTLRAFQIQQDLDDENVQKVDFVHLPKSYQLLESGMFFASSNKKLMKKLEVSEIWQTGLSSNNYFLTVTELRKTTSLHCKASLRIGCEHQLWSEWYWNYKTWRLNLISFSKVLHTEWYEIK